MKIEIYQINLGRDKKHLAFSDLKSKNPDRTLYDKVYAGQVEAENLEDVFYIFNMKKPADYKARSLSVSDVVHVFPGSKIPEGYYLCKSFGWLKVNF